MYIGFLCTKQNDVALFSDAEKIIVKAAKYNKKTLQTPIFTLTDDETADAKKTGCVEGFSGIGRVFTGNYPRLRKRFLALFVLWFINSGSFYGITLNIRNIGGNFYMNILLTAVVEIPAVFLIIFMVEKWEVGRRSILMAAYFLCGALNLMVAGIQWYAGSGEVWTILIRILALGGKFAISGAYAVLYLFTTEQFPTVAKNSGLGTIVSRYGLGDQNVTFKVFVPSVLGLVDYFVHMSSILVQFGNRYLY